MHADAWAALGQWGTVGIAGVAAVIAIKQLTVMRKTAEDVAQPNVVAFIDHNPTNWQFADFVVKNFGQTPAYNIKVKMKPLQVSPWYHGSTGETANELYIPSQIAVLAPGQEWRTFWDSAMSRQEHKAVLSDDPVTGRVTYWDKKRLTNNVDATAEAPFDTPIWIDPNMYRNMLRPRPDDPAEVISGAIASVAGVLDSFGTDGSGIWVHSEPAEAQRARREEQRQYIQQVRRVIHEQLYRGVEQQHDSRQQADEDGESDEHEGGQVE